jgi:Domain of unknown function (DUF4382)
MAGKRIPERSIGARRARPAGKLIVECAAIAAAFLILGWLQIRVLEAASTDQGVLELRIKDHREAIGDFSRLTLKFGNIGISPRAGFAFWKTSWRELSPALTTIDLTKYTSGESVTIFTGMLVAGAFDAIQLKLDGIEALLKKNQRQAQVKNLLAPIKLSFSVEPGRKTVVILDLVVFDMSDHPPRGYELGIKGYELFVDGKLVDKVPPG